MVRRQSAQRARHPHPRTVFRLLLLLMFLATGLFLIMHSREVSPAGKAQTASDSATKIVDAVPADPFNRLNTIVLKDGRVVESYATDLSVKEISSETAEPVSAEKRRELEKATAEQAPQKIHRSSSPKLMT